MELKHIKQVEDFLLWIKDKGGSVETTRAYITKVWFNNYGIVSAKAINVLKQQGIIKNSRSYCKGRGQTWTILKEEYNLIDIFKENSTLEEKSSTLEEKSSTLKNSTLKSSTLKEYKLKYKGIEEVILKINPEEIKIAKEGFVMLSDAFSEDNYKDFLKLSGFDKYKQEFFYQKALIKIKENGFVQ